MLTIVGGVDRLLAEPDYQVGNLTATEPSPIIEKSSLLSAMDEHSRYAPTCSETW